MKILFAASEVAPFAKTGGLADVVGSLPRAVADHGHDVAVIMPLYRCTRQAHPPYPPLAKGGTGGVEPTEYRFEIPIGTKSVTGRLWRSRLPRSEVPVYLVEQPDYFDRDDPALGKGLYQYQVGKNRLRDYPDNCQRFTFFSRAVLAALPLLNWWPDIVHGNDWQTGLVPVYLRELYSKGPYAARYRPIRTLFTVHNLAYQGIFWHWDMALTGLDWSLFNWRQLEFYGHLNLIKAGIVFADGISTVSPRYAEEIQTPEYGCGLEGVLRQYRDKLVGIVNGVDYAEWNPETDPHIARRYTVDAVSAGKAACKRDLQQRLGLAERGDVPLLGMVSRLVDQKGVSLIRRSAHQLIKENVQLVVLGTGEAVYHRFLEQLMKQYPEQVAVRLQFSEPFAHQIEAGADMFIMPSRFEPSGLSQLYSLKYGTIPIVRDTGGLHDTVTDYTPETLAARTATGFVFQKYTVKAFLAVVRRALDVYRSQPNHWSQLIGTAMRQDWSWGRSAQAYEQTYSRIMARDGK